MQRGQRILEDHGHLAAAQLAHPGRAGGDEVLAVEADVPGYLRAAAVVQAHDAEAGDALAGTRLADDAQGAAPLETERDALQQKIA